VGLNYVWLAQVAGYRVLRDPAWGKEIDVALQEEAATEPATGAEALTPRGEGIPLSVLAHHEPPGSRQPALEAVA